MPVSSPENGPLRQYPTGVLSHRHHARCRPGCKEDVTLSALLHEQRIRDCGAGIREVGFGFARLWAFDNYKPHLSPLPLCPRELAFV
jgi:hypothetical protein